MSVGTTCCPSCGNSDIERLSTPDPSCFDSDKEAVAICNDCGEPLAENEVEG